MASCLITKSGFEPCLGAGDSPLLKRAATRFASKKFIRAVGKSEYPYSDGPDAPFIKVIFNLDRSIDITGQPVISIVYFHAGYRMGFAEKDSHLTRPQAEMLAVALNIGIGLGALRAKTNYGHHGLGRNRKSSFRCETGVSQEAKNGDAGNGCKLTM